MTKESKIILLAVLVFLIGLAIPSYTWTRKNIAQVDKFYNSTHLFGKNQHSGQGTSHCYRF